MACKRTKQNRKRYCLSDFRHTISIFAGEIVPTIGDYNVTNDKSIITCRAKVKTTSGQSYFNGVNTGDEISHVITIPFTSTLIEKNYMLLMNDNYYNIDNVTNENEDNLYLVLRCSKRGERSKEANWR